MMYTIVRQHGNTKDLTLKEISRYIEVAITKVDEKLSAGGDDKSVLFQDQILSVKVCEKSDLDHFANKKYSDMYWKEMQQA